MKTSEAIGLVFFPLLSPYSSATKNVQRPKVSFDYSCYVDLIATVQ